MPDSASILIAMRPALYHEIFAGEADARLRSLAELTFQGGEQNLTSSELAGQIAGHDIVITSWGTPVFTAEVLKAADCLRLIAHSAGTIKRLLPPAVFADGRRVTHAAAAMAPAVAETTLLLILLGLRKLHRVDRVFREGGWLAARALTMDGELAQTRIGIVGAGHTGRALIQCLRPLAAELWVYDPYLDAAQAETLAVKRVTLEQLLKECPVVTLQAPSTTATYRMIGAEQFGWLQDGALFINTARSHLLDEAALLAELQSGRIYAALDVFEEEPLPAASPFLKLDNVIVTPHVASSTRETRLRQGLIIAEEVALFLGESELRYEVTGDMLDIIA
ncbi:MAG: hydroxyacid dehydrogenase [Chloroflexi bacterium]|nr:hydroxyacid dehydrogenase [Chloroflexota bacterium]